MKLCELTDKIFVSLARVGRTLYKPVLKAKVDIDCNVYPDDESETATVSTRIKGEPKIKLMDLAIALVAARAVYRLFREIFRD